MKSFTVVLLLLLAVNTGLSRQGKLTPADSLKIKTLQAQVDSIDNLQKQIVGAVQQQFQEYLRDIQMKLQGRKEERLEMIEQIRKDTVKTK